LFERFYRVTGHIVAGIATAEMRALENRLRKISAKQDELLSRIAGIEAMLDNSKAKRSHRPRGL